MRQFFFIFVVALFIVSSCARVSVKNDAVAPNARPIVTFVFDDGNDTDYTVAKDIFKTHNAVACTAVVTDRVNTEKHLSVL